MSIENIDYQNDYELYDLGEWMTNSLDIIIYADSINEGHSAELSDDEARKVKSRVALHLNMSEYNEYEATKIGEERRRWLAEKIKHICNF